MFDVPPRYSLDRVTSHGQSLPIPPPSRDYSSYWPHISFAKCLHPPFARLYTRSSVSTAIQAAINSGLAASDQNLPTPMLPVPCNDISPSSCQSTVQYKDTNVPLNNGVQISGVSLLDNMYDTAKLGSTATLSFSILSSPQKSFPVSNQTYVEVLLALLHLFTLLIPCLALCHHYVLAHRPYIKITPLWTQIVM